MHATISLAFAGLLRLGEITRDDDSIVDFAAWHPTRRSIQLYDDYLQLTLTASKTDPYRKGVTITVAAASDDACAVKSIKHFL